MTNRENAEQIFLAGVRSVLPEKLITKMMSVDGSVLTIQDSDFPSHWHQEYFSYWRRQGQCRNGSLC